MWRGGAQRVKRMKFGRQVEQIKGNSMRLVGGGCGLYDSRVKSNTAHKREFRGIRQSLQVGNVNQVRDVPWKVGKRRPRVAKDRLRSRMAVLDVKDRIVARLFAHFGNVEFEDSVVLAEQHHEADRVAPDFIDDFA